jgi:hypothetical protein
MKSLKLLPIPILLQTKIIPLYQKKQLKYNYHVRQIPATFNE